MCSVCIFQVVGNSAITKTSKIRLFHNKTMKDISLLYKWTGVQRWSKFSRKKDNDDGSNEVHLPVDSLFSIDICVK